MFAGALFLAIAVLTLIQVILIAVKPAYQQLALRCVYGVSIVIIVLAAYWLVHVPSATAPGSDKAPASKTVAA
jgi:hypothetical protein